MLVHLYRHLASLVQQVQQKKLLIPAISVTLLPPETQGVLLMLPVHSYRPILSRLLSGVERHQDADLHDGRVRWLLSQEFHRTLSQHWQMYRLTPDQTIDLVSSLLQKRDVEPAQTNLKPYSQEISECLTDEFADIFPDPWHIRPNVLLRAISRYRDFLQTVRRYSLNSRLFLEYRYSRMLPEPTVTDIRLYREWNRAGWGSPHYTV